MFVSVGTAEVRSVQSYAEVFRMKKLLTIWNWGFCFAQASSQYSLESDDDDRKQQESKYNYERSRAPPMSFVLRGVLFERRVRISTQENTAFLSRLMVIQWNIFGNHCLLIKLDEVIALDGILREKIYLGCHESKKFPQVSVN